MASDTTDMPSGPDAEPTTSPKIEMGSSEWNNILKPYFRKFGESSMDWVDLYKNPNLNKTFLTKALTDIPPGTQIFLDYPLLFVDPDLEPVPEATRAIQSKVETLDSSGKALFYSLPNFFNGRHTKPFSICRSWSLPLVTGHRHVHTAPQPDPENHPIVCLAEKPEKPLEGVFPYLAKFVQHSCAPNAVARLIDDEQLGICLAVRTCRSILPGEPMTIDWINSKGTHTERLNLHMAKFGSPCRCRKCLACSQTDAVCATSDQQRRDMEQLQEQVRSGTNVLSLRTLGRLQKLLHICVTENIFDETLAEVHFAGYEAMLRCNDRVRALEFFFRYQDHMNNLLGEKNPLLDTEELDRLAASLGKEAYAGYVKVAMPMANDAELEAWLFRTHEEISRPDLVRSYADFQDEHIFRNFWTIPSEYLLSDDWVDDDGQPVRHWVLLAETLAVSDPIGLTVMARDKAGRNFTVCLKKLREQGTLTSIYVPRGSLVVMLYVTREQLEGGELGVQPKFAHNTFVRATLFF